MDECKVPVLLRSVTSLTNEAALHSRENRTWELRGCIEAEAHGRRSSSFRENIKRSATFVKHISHDLARLPRNVSRVQNSDSPDNDHFATDLEMGTADVDQGGSRVTRTMSGAEYALKGLRFISKATATADQKSLWEAVEARFHKLASADYTLPRSNFAECIGGLEADHGKIGTCRIVVMK